MTARDAATQGLDHAVDGIGTGASAAELFAVVDVLDAQPSLRRSLSDPSASDEQRSGLAHRVLDGKVGPETISVVTEVVKAAWSSGRQMATALERQAVRLALRGAQQDGSLSEVTSQLQALRNAVENNPELSGALRNQTYPVEGKQALVDRLISTKVAPATQTLAARAVKARKRNFSVTVASYLEMAADMSGHQIARVTVARPLDEGRTERLRNALQAQTGKPVTLQIEVDPSVIGGMSVAIGDEVIESTVAGRLEQARRQLNNL